MNKNSGNDALMAFSAVVPSVRNMRTRRMTFTMYRLSAEHCLPHVGATFSSTSKSFSQASPALASARHLQGETVRLGATHCGDALEQASCCAEMKRHNFAFLVLGFQMLPLQSPAQKKSAQRLV